MAVSFAPVSDPQLNALLQERQSQGDKTLGLYDVFAAWCLECQEMAEGGKFPSTPTQLKALELHFTNYKSQLEIWFNCNKNIENRWKFLRAEVQA